jgi:hypothetical protein
MGKVYSISNVNSTRYFGTKREADRAWNRDDDHERADAYDAAEECNRLATEVDRLYREQAETLCVLREFVDIAPQDMLTTAEGQQACRLIWRLSPSYADYMKLPHGPEQDEG